MSNHTSSLEFSHFPVMLNEVINISLPYKGGTYVDCTFGGGGYSKKILKFPKVFVKAIDRDSKVKKIAKELEKKFPDRFKFYQIKFSEIDRILKNKVDVVIFDLGISSFQLNDFDRGFSFKSNKNLGMSMGLNEISAQDAINNLSEKKFKTNYKNFWRRKRSIQNCKEYSKI